MALLTAGLQTGIGLAQFGVGLFKKKPKRPKYNIPQEVFENMSDAEYAAFTGLPEEQKSQAISQMRESSTRALYEANTRKAGLGTISQLAGAEQKAQIELAVQDSVARARNLDRLQAARSEVASQREKKFQSQLGAYQEKKQERDRLIGAGLQNIMGGVGSLEAGAEKALGFLAGGPAGAAIAGSGGGAGSIMSQAASTENIGLAGLTQQFGFGR